MAVYDAELQLFQRMLKQMTIPFSIVSRDKPLLAQADKGLRVNLGLDRDERPWEKYLRQNMAHNTIYRFVDDFEYSYVLFLLPEYAEQDVFLIGPYCHYDRGDEQIKEFCEKNVLPERWVPLLCHYNREIIYLQSSHHLLSILNALGETIWGEQKFSSEDFSNGMPEILSPVVVSAESHSKEGFMYDVRAVEARYAAENRLMQAVAQGRTHRARAMLSSMSPSRLENRATEVIRNAQNYSIILNTLLRKAAEQGGVHPLYIDRLSSECAHRIERVKEWEELRTLWQEMAQRYCMLVKKHSSQKYSQLVQQVISRVDYDLAADLSLKANAEALNVNASYFSTLFRKEMGVTLTDYVNRKRVEHAIYLLGISNLSISAVGQYCGIQDDNYFTKMFKKYTGKTPKQYRLENTRFPK